MIEPLVVGSGPATGGAFLDRPSGVGRDNPTTLASLGVIAYVGETLGHEAIGHGGLCLLSGGRVTALAPLWMRCSLETLPMILAGPLFNFGLALVCAVVLRRRSRSDTVSYFLWLCCAFNGLVACGYLIVGGATTFGDWGVVFGAVDPAWLWRTVCVALGLSGYLLGLRVLARLYAAIAGDDGFRGAKLAARTLVPSAAAAVVASAAEIVGGHASAGSLTLALGCTLCVGLSLGRIRTFRPRSGSASPNADLCVPLGLIWIIAGAVTAVAFVVFIGRGGV